MPLLLTAVFTSCSLFRNTFRSDDEDELVVSRRYVGNFVDFRITMSEDIAGQNIIWIKTSFESRTGKISAVGKNCDFRKGERLYLRRTLYDPGIGAGYWIYYIENDSGVAYKATDYQHDRKITTEKMFQAGF